MKILKLGIILSTILLLSGCSFLNASKLNNALVKMNELDSYQMDIIVAVLEEEIHSVGYVDGNYQEVEVLGVTERIIILDDGVYSISPHLFHLNALWPEEDLDTSEYDDFDEILTYDFNKEGDYYVFSGEIPLLEDMDTMKIKIDDEYISEMILEGEIAGYDAEIKIIYSEFNNVELTIPDYLTIEEYNQLANLFVENEIYNVIYTPEFFELVGDERHIFCSFDSQVCNIEMDPHFMYHMGYQTVVDPAISMDTYIPFVEFSNDSNYPLVEEELFEFINLLYEYYTTFDMSHVDPY